MKILLSLVVAALIAAVGGAVTGWNKAGALQREINSLRAELKVQQDKSAADVAVEKKKREVDALKLKTAMDDLARLRGEVTQLRLSGKDAEKLQAENQRLILQSQQARAAANAAAPAATTSEPKPDGAQKTFPKDSWANAGYASPASAMVTAMWAMHAGDPKAYFDSLTPTEQERVLKGWEGKTEAEIAAKFRADAARIDSLSIVGEQIVAANEIWLTVTAPGPDGTLRTMVVPMISADGTTWKFGGFQRPAKAPAR